MSRQHITKAAQYYKNKQESVVAQQSSNKFTAKQSQFARKEEERQVRDAQQSSGSVISKFESVRRETNRMSGAAPSTVSGNKLMMGTGNKRLEKYQLDDDRRRPRDETEHFGNLMGQSAAAPQLSGGDDGEGDDAEAPRKKSRIEKFQEVVANSKHHRHEQQKERAARDKETVLLDEEFNDVMHLLTKRDRRQEERDAFLASGNPEVRDMLKAFKANRKAKILKLDDVAAKVITAASQEEEAANALDAADRALLASLTKIDPKTMAHGRNGGAEERDEAPAPGVTLGDDDDDDFDALMGAMRMETKKAHAVERTLTEEEELEHLQRMQLLQADRGQVPTVDASSEQWTRKEWVQKGGDAVFHMGDDAEGDGDNIAFDEASYDEEGDYEHEEAEEEGDGGDEGSGEAGPVAGSSLSNPVDRALANLESFSSRGALMSVDERSTTFQAIISELHAHSRRHTVYASQSFRLLLMDAQRRLTNGMPLTDFAMLVLYAVPFIFPVTDYRHEVVTPYLILLCSAISQMQLKTLRNVKEAILLCSLLQSAMSEGSKYCAEMLVGPLNILALQVTKRDLEPHAHQKMRMPCPLLGRCDEALLAADANDASSLKFTDAIAAPIQLLSGAVEPREQLLFAAYKLLAGVATSLSGNAAFPCAVGGPVRRLFALLDGHVSPALLGTHNATAAVIDEMCTSAEKKRTPLAMRSFRPRPIRLFEPLLVENVDPEVKEHRELKKEIREDRKRVVRHVQAEAVVERRAREKEAHAESSRREEKYNQLIGELQAQQHIMKSVDMSMSKARSSKKKSISGAPKSSEEGAGGGGNDQ